MGREVFSWEGTCVAHLVLQVVRMDKLYLIAQELGDPQKSRSWDITGGVVVLLV